jgi:predicted phage baseplate assembly protein
VLFGDGINGAMPPTGVGNVHARYRRGLGASGNLPAGSLVQMIDSAPGLQGVTNPLPTTGGADPPGLAQLRQTTAGSLVTFGRAVSADDYAALALQFPGITKATANWVLRGPDGRPVPIPYMQLNVAVADGTPIAGSLTASNLRGFLDSYRDTNIPLRILDFTPVPIDVSVTVDILPQYPKQATLTAIEAALNPGINPDGSAGYFAFANTSPGVSVHLSTVYAAVQSIPGVADAIVTVLRPAGSNQAVWDTIFVRPTEIVEIGNVAGDPSQGTLLVTYGSGGFADQ